jgi:hypothetical protein
MTELTTQYFNSNVRGKIIGVDRIEVSIKDLVQAGLDIDFLKNCDQKESKSSITIKNPKETESAKVEFSTKNHLICGKYSSPE